MGTVYGSGTYQEGTVVEIGALPGENFYFNGWQDGDMNNPRSITVTEDAYFIASFALEPTPTFDVTIYYDENQGFVLGAGTYLAGATATIVAIPSDGYQFVKWGDGNTENPREIFVDHDIILAAFFNGTGVDEAQAYDFGVSKSNKRQDSHYRSGKCKRNGNFRHFRHIADKETDGWRH